MTRHLAILTGILVALGCSAEPRTLRSLEVECGALDCGATPSHEALASCAQVPTSVGPSLPVPSWRLDFEGSAELSVKGVAIEVPAGGADSTSYVAGRGGKAILPKGVYLKTPASSVLSLGTGSITAWIGDDAFHTMGSDPLTIFDTSNPGNGWAVSLKRAYGASDNQLRGYFADGTGRFGWVDAPLGGWHPGQWHQVVMTWGPSFVRLYVDGIKTAETSSEFFPKTMPVGETLFLMSTKRDPFLPASGNIRGDLFRSYTTELSDVQVAELFRQEVPAAFTLRSASGCLNLELGREQDGFGIRRIYDGSDGSMKTQQVPSRGLWRVVLRNADGKTVVVDNTSAVFAKLSSTRAIDSKGQLVTTLKWTDLPLVGSTGALSPATLDVSMDLVATASDAIEASLRVSEPAHRWTVLEATVLPLSGVSLGSHSGNSSLVLPDHSMGRNLPDPFAASLQWALPTDALYPSRAFGMQWVGIATNRATSSGLYFASHDRTASIKSFRFSRTPIPGSPRYGLNAAVAVYATATNALGNGFVSPGPTVIKLQRGGWYDFAQTYRSFAATAPWYGAKSLAQRTDVPAWMKNAGLINIGASPTDSLTLDGQMKAMGAPSGLLMHHRSQWDMSNVVATQFNDTPFFAPKINLDEDLAATQAMSIPTALYFDPVAWDSAHDGPAVASMITTAQGLKMALKHESGAAMLTSHTNDVETPAFNPLQTTGQQHLYMCPASAAWRQTVAQELATHLGDHSVEGLYLDQIASYSPRICHATDHGHAAGGGHHWVDGHRAMLADVRQLMTPGQGIYTESFSEPYVSLVDGFLTWDTALQYAVPLAPAVYHTQVQFLGRDTEVALPATGPTGIAVSMAKQAELFTFGAMAGFHDISLTAVPLTDFRNYLFSLARARRTYQPFVVMGAMRAPATVMLAPATVTTPLLVAPSATAAALPMVSLPGANTDNTPGIWTGPVVMNSVWTAPSKQVAVLLVSAEWTGSARVVDVTLPSSYSATTKATLRVVYPDGTVSSLGATSLPATVRVPVDARGIALVEVTPL